MGCPSPTLAIAVGCNQREARPCLNCLTAVDADEHVAPKRVVLLVQLVHRSGGGLQSALVLSIDTAFASQQCWAEARHRRGEACERMTRTRSQGH